jgi:hypothetical protein
MSENIIFAYTRAQAIADGVLVDVTKTAKEAGFKVSVAMTDTVNAEYVQVPAGVEGQDEEGRLWDILWMCSLEARRQKENSVILFSVLVQNSNKGPKKVDLKCVCGPDDEGAPASPS